MTSERIIFLLNAELDDALTAAERGELQQLLAESEDACSLQQELAQVHSALAALPEQPLPKGLREQILSSISLPNELQPSTAQAQQHPAASLLDRLLDRFLNRLPQLVPYGFATAAGAVLAVALMSNPGPQTDDMFGSMTPHLAPGVARNVTLLGADRLNLPGLSGSTTLELRDGVPVVDVILDSTGPVAVAIDFSASGLRFGLLGQLEGELDSLVIEDQVLRAQGQGRQRFAVQLQSATGAPAAPGAAINLGFQRAGSSVHQATLTFGPAAGQSN